MRKVVFLTGTRADFGKIKSLINILVGDDDLDVNIFATGMHMNQKYGKTVVEIEKCGYKNIYPYINHKDDDSMDIILSKTINGFSHYVYDIKPDLIIIHGDRVETLAGAIVGSLNNILVAHFAGGEVAGTVDELIRHSVTKLSHIHFVSNEVAKQRLIQMGEVDNTIFNIGSPDVDVMFSDSLPTLTNVRDHYGIDFKNYAIAIYHPVTTEIDLLPENINAFVDALMETNDNYIVIYPNNDHGSSLIITEYSRLMDVGRFNLFPSLRFEYFLTLLKEAKYIIGNSSSGVREAPYYNVPSINIGSRQNNRSDSSIKTIINCGNDSDSIICSVKKVEDLDVKKTIINTYGHGNSNALFYKQIKSESLWKIPKQKQFKDYNKDMRNHV